MAPFVALTGTPGTGKTRTSKLLAKGLRRVEVAELAQEARASRRSGSGWVVDTEALGAWMELRPPAKTCLVVGHLAHLLPVSRIIVLRCHPVELEHRLNRARKGTRSERRANAVAEAIDYILVEARSTKKPTWQVDTTHASPVEVAKRVSQVLRTGRQPRSPQVDWLSDPVVTEWLLRGDRYRR